LIFVLRGNKKMNKNFYTIIISLTFAITAFASLPPDVPGEMLSNEVFFNHFFRNRAQQTNAEQVQESGAQAAPTLRRSSRTIIPIHDQIAQDTTVIRHGSGAVFVPRMSEASDVEPIFHVYDTKGERVEVGETGRKISLPPGQYTLRIIDRTPFEIKQNFVIYQDEITPITPNWSAVRIEVISSSGIPIRSEYDLASIDPLMFIGRGYGRDLSLAEDLRIWFLPMGYYKILGVGSALNAIDNFLTFALYGNGELLRFTVVKDPDTRRIVGGGTVFGDIMSPTRRQRDWRHTVNIGGSVDFNHYRDQATDSLANITYFSLLLFDRLNFRRNRADFQNIVRFDIGMSVEEADLKTMRITNDEFRINSLFTHRFVDRFGPYFRSEFSTSLFRRSIDFSRETRERENARHAFIIFDNYIPDTVSDQTSQRIDSTSTSFTTTPAFSPIQLQIGSGANIQIMKNHLLDLRFLSGLGMEHERRWDSWRLISEHSLVFDSTSAIYEDIFNTNIERIVLTQNNGERLEVGPEFILNYFLFATRYLTLDGELRLFMPFDRFSNPNFRSHTLVSLRITRNFSLDYDYTFNIVMPRQEELRTQSHRHRVLARFSFARR